MNSQFSPNFSCLMVVKAEKDQGHVPAKLFLYIDSLEIGMARLEGLAVFHPVLKDGNAADGCVIFPWNVTKHPQR